MNRVPYNKQIITMECGLVLHSHVIGLPYFREPLEALETDTEETTAPKPKVSVN